MQLCQLAAARSTVWVGLLTTLTAACAPRLRAQTLELTDPSSGLRLQVATQSSLPMLRILLPGEPESSRGIEVVFPEHVTVRRHGSKEAKHPY